MKNKLQLLFLCTGNSCRSQMAEGLCRHFYGNTIEAFSAGIEAHGVNLLAVQVMNEIGIDISNQQSKELTDLKDKAFDYVVTVCDHANEICPVFIGETHMIHQSFADPPKLAKYAATETEALDCYRRVRDEIKEFILGLSTVLNH